MNVACRERWTWIDALFMGAPVWIHLAQVTGDDRYPGIWRPRILGIFQHLLGCATRACSIATAGICRCVTKMANKVFWSRGNGWVFAAFARILPKLPPAHPNRQTYLDRLPGHGCKTGRTAARRRTLDFVADQRTRSRQRPKTVDRRFPRTDWPGASTRVCWIARPSLPAVERAWSSLVSNLYADGRLAYVQPSGSAPQIVHKESTDVYGVGAFLLAASEVYRLANPVAPAQ